jgi:hypothetical protein
MYMNDLVDFLGITFSSLFEDQKRQNKIENIARLERQVKLDLVAAELLWYSSAVKMTTGAGVESSDAN